MAENINLISHEWKHTLETTPTSSVTSLVSLYDLLFDSDGKFWSSYEDPSNAGIRLQHDIICLNRNILTASMAVDTTLAMPSSPWQTFGIDIALSHYDARAKQKVIENKTRYTIPSSNAEYPIFSSESYTLYDKDSAIPPATLNEFTNSGVLRNNSNVTGTPSWDVYKAPSIGIAGTNTNTDIMLSNEDTVFRSTLVTQDGFYAYNKIFLNPKSAYAVLLIARAIGIDLSIINYGNSVEFNNANITINSEEIINRITGNPESESSVWAVLNQTSKTTLFEEILRNTFVWVRAPFYADYIIPESFQQDLTPTSKVVHSEIMLSGNGDFRKYDEFNYGTTIATDSTTNRSEDTQPYIPSTSPTVDFITSDFISKHLSDIKEGNKDGNYSSKISELYKVASEQTRIKSFLNEYVSGNNPIIKGLPVAPINRSDALSKDNSAKNLMPPNYFDPESRMTDKDYVNAGKFPTVIPLDGNIYADGRIISPTIDELWYMIKKLVAGRPSDIVVEADVTSYANVNRAVNLDKGIPFGSGDNHMNDTDTSMTEVPDSEFNFSYEGDDNKNKFGDPVGFHYTRQLSSNKEDINNDKIVIDKFINQNNAIVYPVYSSLKSLSDRITVFDKTRSSDTKGDRYITNFTAWDSIGESESGSAVLDNQTVVSGVWAPRKVPYSLRELEALIMGNKYNIISLARFVKENFTVSGKLGKTTEPFEDDWSDIAAGSLYQMHRNYNFEVDNPNTFYSRNGTETGFDSDGKVVGTKVVLDDFETRTPEEVKAGAMRYRKDYGTSKAINANPEYYSSSDVYLAADGTWRYVGDHIRIPILRCDY